MLTKFCQCGHPVNLLLGPTNPAAVVERSKINANSFPWWRYSTVTSFRSWWCLVEPQLATKGKVAYRADWNFNKDWCNLASSLSPTGVLTWPTPTKSGVFFNSRLVKFSVKSTLRAVAQVKMQYYGNLHWDNGVTTEVDPPACQSEKRIQSHDLDLLRDNHNVQL